MDDLVDFVVRSVEDAAQIAVRRFRERPPAESKADGSFVTTADVEVEQFLRERLAARCPRDEIYGEELGITKGRTGRRWVIDPINGTTLFVRHIPTFSMNVALLEDEQPLIGVTAFPMNGVVLYAARGAGSWRRIDGGAPERLRVSSYPHRRGARVAIHNLARWSSELLLALHAETYLLEWQGTGGVAAGEIEAAVVAGMPMAVEDLGPLPLLVEEAGGRVTDLNGAELLKGDGTILATNGPVHDAFLSLVDGIATGRDHRTLRQP